MLRSFPQIANHFLHTGKSEKKWANYIVSLIHTIKIQNSYSDVVVDIVNR